jgi:hypothetical protein
METVRLNRLHWFGHVQRMEENRIHKKVLYMNLETTWLRGRPRNRWQDDVTEDGRLFTLLKTNSCTYFENSFTFTLKH